MGRWLIFGALSGEIKSLIKMMKDKEAPKRYKVILVLGMIYLFSPVDLIPAPILGLSIIDDITICTAILYYLREPLSKYKEESVGKKKSKYKNKKVVEVEDFVVVDESEEKQENED